MMTVGNQRKVQTGNKNPTEAGLHTIDQQGRSRGKRRQSAGQKTESKGKKKDLTGGQRVTKRTRTRQVLPSV